MKASEYFEKHENLLYKLIIKKIPKDELNNIFNSIDSFSNFNRRQSMHNLVLSPIDPLILIDSIAEKVTANILNTVRNEQPTPEPQDELLTVQEAANLLRLSVPTIYSKVSRLQLPCMKQGKKVYFSKNELLEYLKAGKKKTFAEIEAEADAYLSKNNQLGL